MTLKKLLRASIETKPIYVDSDSLIHQIMPCTDGSREITTCDDWDMHYRDIRDSNIYKMFEDRVNGNGWPDGLLADKKPSFKKLRLESWDSMISDITQNGYSFRPFEKCKSDEYISVMIGRDGHIILYNGIHRTCCCLLSSVKNKIPVKVIYRHPEWDAFKASISGYEERNKKIYCHVPHPDLDSIEHYWNNDRAELIAEKSFYPRGRVLDIGSHWGTTSFTLAKHGFTCVAIENNECHFRKTSKISRMNSSGGGPTFTAINTNALDYIAYGETDTLVMLNIAHHFQMKKEDYDAFIRFLKANKFKEIFYQSHKDKDKWSTQSATCLKPAQYRGRIMRAAGLKHYKTLATFGGRDLYHLF